MSHENQPALEYNLAGGLLMTTRERDLLHLGEELKSAGYTHACVLPVRGLAGQGSVEKLSQYPLTIVHFENIWNDQTSDYPLPVAIMAGLIGHLRRIMGDKSEPPLIQDHLLAGRQTADQLLKEMTCLPGIKFISHTVDVNSTPDRDKLLIEISPHVKMLAAELQSWTQRTGVGLVFDPSHLLPEFIKYVSAPNAPTHLSKDAWEGQFQYFRSAIEVVDINPPSYQKDTHVRNLSQGHGLLYEVAQAAKELEGVQFLRVEIPVFENPLVPVAKIPVSSLGEKNFELLRAIGQALKEA